MESNGSAAHKHRIAHLIHPQLQQLNQVKILVVGVGGIGCEILKVLAKLSIGQVDILDMDTIEITNLNRQFLFKTQHKGLSKALVARQSVLKLNPNLNIKAHHMNIKDLHIGFFAQFGFLIMALDNIEARNYVNKVGVRLGIPIIDAGTMAYTGNVSTILAGVSKCYVCEPKVASQQSFPVCTIRNRPQKPIHCIVWAKMLFEVLFAAQEEEAEVKENQLQDMANLIKVDSQVTVMEELFQRQIEQLKNDKTDADDKLKQILQKRIRVIPSDVLREGAGQPLIEAYQGHNKVQSLGESAALFAESFHRLRKIKIERGGVVFEKDDDDVIFFVSSAANLRMHCFTIEPQSFNEVKNMAGRIVPAIASTNAIVSGIEVIELLKHVRGAQEKMRGYFIQNQHKKITPLKLEKPLRTCQICSPKALPMTFSCNFKTFSLQQLLTFISEASPLLTDFSLNYGSKEIYNTDDPKEQLLKKTIFQLSESFAIDLILTDENTSKNICVIWMVHNEEEQKFSARGREKLIPQPETEAMQEEPEAAAGGDDDSDLIVFEDAGQPEVVIVEVRKRAREEEKSPSPGRKKQKVE